MQLPARREDGSINVVIETPRGSASKFRYDEHAGLFVLSRLLPLASRIRTTGASLRRRRRRTLYHYRYSSDNPNSLSGDRVKSLARDSRGYLWVGAIDAGLNKFDPNRHTAITTLAEKGLPDWVIQAQVGHVAPEMASARFFEEEWLAALDDFRNWLIREAA